HWPPDQNPRPGPGPFQPRPPIHPEPPPHHQQGGPSETIIRKELNFTSLSLRLVSVQTGEILVSSSRRKPFGTDELTDVVDSMLDSMKKILKK
ncbi:MAG: hypothetical protein HY547_06735, partial [Elusimicrobia bacterium]|nr:hypothetical protein [Elusimicrobiota bacterium]